MFAQPTQTSVKTQPARKAARCDIGMALARATTLGSAEASSLSFFLKAASTEATKSDAIAARNMRAQEDGWRGRDVDRESQLRGAAREILEGLT